MYFVAQSILHLSRVYFVSFHNMSNVRLLHMCHMDTANSQPRYVLRRGYVTREMKLFYSTGFIVKQSIPRRKFYTELANSHKEVVANPGFSPLSGIKRDRREPIAPFPEKKPRMIMSTLWTLNSVDENSKLNEYECQSLGLIHTRAASATKIECDKWIAQ